MAEELDVVNRITDDVNNLLAPLVGRKFPLPEQFDVARYGAYITMPPTLCYPSKPPKEEVDSRLDAGKLTVYVESDTHDGTIVQFLNEGRRQDLQARAAVTIAIVNTDVGLWTISGTATLGNMIGVQTSTAGATYAVAAADTPATIAAGIAASCTEAGIACTAQGATISLPYGAEVNTGSIATYVKALSRRVRTFYVFLFSPDPFIRQLAVRWIEKLYVGGQKKPMNDGSEIVVEDFLGTIQEDPEGQGEERDELYIARSGWSIQFTVTDTVTKVPILATTCSASDGVPPPRGVLLASQL